MKRRRPTVITCTFTKRPSGRVEGLRLDLVDLRWSSHPEVLPGLWSDEARDLFEIARTVHEIDRRMPRRITAERVRQFEVEMSIRKPERWSKRAKVALADLLYAQGNAEWSFAFNRRPKAVGARLDTVGARAPAEGKSAQPFPDVALFSGGLDSTCGAATLQSIAARTLLVSYYTGNLKKQSEIASALGFANLVQVQAPWSRSGEGHVGGQFWYRSFLYLTLGGVVGAAVGAKTIYQFENGPLAFAVPPAPIYRMTRHAHPVVHRAAESLFDEILGRRFSIRNPFVLLTKGEAVDKLRFAMKDYKRFATVVALTETCWYLRARSIVGGVTKDVGAPCGACIPCIVRRAALGSDAIDDAVDLASTSDRNARRPVVRVHLEAYKAFAMRLLGPKYGVGQFLADVPTITETAVTNSAAGVSASDLFDLYRRFARELLAVYR